MNDPSLGTSGETWTYTYDLGGNITSKKRYVYTTGSLVTAQETITYSYGDATWGDLLTSYNGQAITYDQIGNPLSDGTWNYTWEHGRQLAAQSSGNTTWTYDYDANGQRVTRTDGNTTYEYGYYGSTLVYEKITQGNTVVAEMYITYGEAGPLYIEYNGTIYYYILNGQGDVVGLAEWDVPPAVLYTYNAWGELESISGTKASTLGMHNPLRYRGYVYDTETKLYYLNSRYYNPEWGRFINADDYITSGQGLLGSNLFSYCGNNPVIRVDVDGESWASLWEKTKNAIDKLLHKGNDYLVSKGVNTAAIGAWFLNMSKDANGVYHANFDCWQSICGYNDLYDLMFDIGTDMASRKFDFRYNCVNYILWVWKGDYINLGAGAELGIYYGGPLHWFVSKKLAMNMGMTVFYKGKRIISYSTRTWWITGFNPKYTNIKAKDLSVVFSVSFNNQGMYYAFKKKYKDIWKFSDARLFAQFSF